MAKPQAGQQVQASVNCSGGKNEAFFSGADRLTSPGPPDNMLAAGVGIFEVNGLSAVSGAQCH